MDEKLSSQIESLRQALASDPRVRRLDEMEKKLSSDPIALETSKKLHEAEEEFEYALSHYGESSELSKSAQKKLHRAKYEMDILPVCKEYNQAYREVRELYAKLDDMLFGEFRSERRCEHHK